MTADVPTNMHVEDEFNMANVYKTIADLECSMPPPQAPQQPAAAVWVQGQPRLVRVVARGWTLMAVLAMRATCTAARTRAARCRGCRNRRPLPQRALPCISCWTSTSLRPCWSSLTARETCSCSTLVSSKPARTSPLPSERPQLMQTARATATALRLDRPVEVA